MTEHSNEAHTSAKDLGGPSKTQPKPTKGNISQIEVLNVIVSHLLCLDLNNLVKTCFSF